ncbi:MAG: tetratricopeptide repeat protein [Candidatus Lokiarchaeota archaeon]|nr:tetratricopeptide repeat protein [Candidatus Lokiarchaeota archaeon]
MVKISSKCFRDMILFSGKYANRLMDPGDIQHTYGFCIGEIAKDGQVEVRNFIPHNTGTPNEKKITKSFCTIDINVYGKNSFICGFFHGFPRSGGKLSEQDVKSLSTFEFGALCIIFDFTRVEQFNNGFLVFQTDGENIKNVPYTISHPEDEDKFYFARSLVALSELYQSSGKITPDGAVLEKSYQDPPIPMDSGKETEMMNPGFESKFLESTPLEYDEYELSIIDQDFEIQKLRSDIELACQLGKNTAYLKLQLANRLLSQMGNESEILRYLESAEEEFSTEENENSRTGLAIVKNELGLFYEDRGNFYTALNYFDDAYGILEKTHDNRRRIRVLNNIGNIYFKLNNFDTALRKYKKAYEESTDIVDQVSIFNNIADVYLKLQNYARAYAILQKNAVFFQETQNEFGLAMVFSKFGRLYFEQGQAYYHLAKKYSNLALAIKKRNEFYRECIEDYELLSIIYLKENSLEIAENILVEGLNLVRTLQFEQKEAFFYHHLGDLYLVKEKFGLCLEYYQLAQEIYEKFGEKEAEGDIYEKLGNIYAENLDQLDKALEHYAKSLVIYQEENFRRKQADLLVKSAEIHIDRNETNSALENFQKAQHLYKIMYDDTSAQIIAERIKSMEY